MDGLQLFIAIAAGIILFLFGVDQFSREVQSISGRRFRRFLSLATRNRWLGFLLGAVVTAVVQSSTATSVIAVGLVNAGVLSFRHSLGIIIGANVGTTVTAQLVALEFTAFAPALILVGFLTGYAPFRWRVLGRSIFYFGLVLFSLELVSSAVTPLRANSEVLALLSRYSSPAASIAVGALFTAVVQSSTVTTGVALILLEKQVVPFSVAVPLVLGANIGTSITALIAAASLDTSARRTAVSHALYNVGGVVMFLPFLGPFESFLSGLGQAPMMRLATAHLLFNATTAAVFLIGVRPFARAVERLVRGGEDELPLEPPPHASEDVATALGATHVWVGQIVHRVRRCYTAAVLALETRDAKIRSSAERTAAMIRFGLDEASEIVHQLSKQSLDARGSKGVLRLVITLDHIRQVVDSIEDLMKLQQNLTRRNVRFSIDALLHVQAVFTAAATLLGAFEKVYDETSNGSHTTGPTDAALAAAIEAGYRRFISLSGEASEGSNLVDFLSIHQRLRSKIQAFESHLLERSD